MASFLGKSKVSKLIDHRWTTKGDVWYMYIEHISIDTYMIYTILV